ncbi:response regulator [Algoriphagus litoralis]|uniref:response regulator n=1 Tax=Algoriphagus litoralis TaxID=2202829 RepID=UPI000DBA0550|nr:response regulator [Algoriphagus litoralis]
MVCFNLIFLVDDDPINNLINRRLLGKAGIGNQIEEFLSAQEALEKIKSIASDTSLLLFLDINMPVLNGWEFLDAYCSNFPDRKDTIVILSSSIDYQDRQKALEYPIVSGFLEKPLSLEKINTQLSTS